MASSPWAIGNSGGLTRIRHGVWGFLGERGL
jgi:hypothetical protein